MTIMERPERSRGREVGRSRGDVDYDAEYSLLGQGNREVTGTISLVRWGMGRRSA